MNILWCGKALMAATARVVLLVIAVFTMSCHSCVIQSNLAYQAPLIMDHLHYKDHHCKSPISIFIIYFYQQTKATCQEQPLYLGPNSSCCTYGWMCVHLGSVTGFYFDLSYFVSLLKWSNSNQTYRNVSKQYRCVCCHSFSKFFRIQWHIFRVNAIRCFIVIRFHRSHYNMSFIHIWAVVIVINFFISV
jgi:hypothetical protein